MVKLLVGLLMLQAVGSRPVHLKPLPARAKITVEAAHWLNGKPDPQVTCPLGPALTQIQVRQMFSTYHVLRELEFHDDYDQIDCVTEGDILVDGKKYRYQYMPINTLTTTWPDGKGHSLGGKHSDSK
jgi:hypothetical protein